MAGQNGYIGNQPSAVPLDASQVPNNLLDYTKLVQQESGYVLGKGSAGTGDTEKVFVGRGLSLSGKNLLADAAVQTMRPQKRQAIQSARTTGGVNSALAAAGGANVTLQATATPMVMAFAAGFGGYGPIDYISAQSADVSITGTPTDLTSYIYADYRGNSAAAPESLMHFEAADGSTVFLDEYGAEWSASGVTVSTAQFKFGQSSALFDGTGPGLVNSTITGLATKAAENNSVALSGQEMSIWVRPVALPASNGDRKTILGFYNAAGYGLELNLYNSAGTVKFEVRQSFVNGSAGNGVAWDVTTLGTVTAVAVDTWYRLRLNYIPEVSTALRVSVAGAAEVLECTSSMTGYAAICDITKAVIGANGAGAQSLNAYVDEFRLFPTIISAGNVTPPATPYTKTDGAIIISQRTMPPQIGESYDSTKAILCHFEGTDGANSTTEDYGNQVSPSAGAGTFLLSSVNPKIGTLCGVLSGASSYIDFPDPKTLGDGSWTLEGYVRLAALPGASTLMMIASAALSGATPYGVQFFYNADATPNRKLGWSLSSNGTSNDLAAAVLETNVRTLTLNQWYHWAVCYDALAGKYFAYWDGTAVAGLSVTSANKPCAISGIRLGASQATTPASFLNGAVDEFRFSQGCRYPNGTAFTPPTTAFGVEGDFFSVPEMKHYQVIAKATAAGNPPVMRQVNRLYLGEVDNSAGTAGAPRNYAILGRYVSALSTMTVATVTAYNHNLGVPGQYQVLKPAMVCVTADLNHQPGDILQVGNAATTNAAGGSMAVSAGRNTARYNLSAAMPYGYSSTGVPTATTAAKWNKYLVAERSF